VEFSVFAESTSKQIKAFRDVYTRIKFACIKTDMEAGRGFVEAIGVTENMNEFGTVLKLQEGAGSSSVWIE
jgi:hypothetical protein